MPRIAAAMLRHRLKPAAYQRAVTLSEYFPVEEAQRAGFFDELADSAELMPRAVARAAEFGKLDPRAHKASKRRIRRALIRKARWLVHRDMLDVALLGLKRMRHR
jgi:enoyl-CoA hydratase